MLTDVDRYATGPGSSVAKMEKIPPGQTCVGTRWREVVRLGRIAHMTIWSEVTDVEPDRRLAMDFRGPAMEGHLVYTLTSIDGTTMLRQQETLEMKGLAWVASGVVRTMLGKRLVGRLADIRDMLEADDGGLPGPLP